MGWESAFKDLQTDAKHFSLIFGLIFICNFFGKDFGSFKILTLISLMICTLIHAIWISFLFFNGFILYIIKKVFILKLIIFYFGLGFVLPSIILLIFHGKSKSTGSQKIYRN